MYEVDLANKKCRRLMGEANPQPRQGKDGEWKSYSSIMPEKPIRGSQVLFIWDRSDTPLLEGTPEGFTPSTITSVVVGTIEDEQAS